MGLESPARIPEHENEATALWSQLGEVGNCSGKCWLANCSKAESKKPLQKTTSDGNRPVRSRAQGCAAGRCDVSEGVALVGPIADLTVSHGDPIVRWLSGNGERSPPALG